LDLSWSSSIQFTHSHTSSLTYTLIISSHLLLDIQALSFLQAIQLFWMHSSSALYVTHPTLPKHKPKAVWVCGKETKRYNFLLILRQMTEHNWLGTWSNPTWVLENNANNSPTVEHLRFETSVGQVNRCRTVEPDVLKQFFCFTPAYKLKPLSSYPAFYTASDVTAIRFCTVFAWPSVTSNMAVIKNKFIESVM
jgi:hypothetical protein